MKTVWIVGAGASHSSSGGTFPLLGDVARTAYKGGVIKKHSQEYGFSYLRDYVQTTFGHDLSRGPKIDLERVLTTLDIDIAVSNKESLGLARRALLSLLTRTLEGCHSRFEGSGAEYVDFVAALKPEDTVITFNWDLLLDDALGRRDVLKADGIRDGGGQYSRFLMTLTGWGEATMDGFPLPSPLIREPSDRGLYLKLHGSIDWYGCTNDSCRVFGRIYPLLDNSNNSDTRCGGCYEPEAPVLVPPTLNKQLRELPAVRRLWTRAAYEVQTAERLVVWGYSLPPTDFFSDWLVRQTRPDILESVVVINPAVSRGKIRVTLNQDYLLPFADLLRRSGASSLGLYKRYVEYAQGIALDDQHPETANAIRELEGSA